MSLNISSQELLNQNIYIKLVHVYNVNNLDKKNRHPRTYNKALKGVQALTKIYRKISFQELHV